MNFPVIGRLLLGGLMYSTLAQADTASQDLASIIPASERSVKRAWKSFSDCATKDPESAIGRYKATVEEAAAFVVAEPRPDTRELLADFTRQLIVHVSENANKSCRSLADLWGKSDPFIRKMPELGLGLSEADIDAAKRLDELGKPYWKEKPELDTRERVLAMWDSYDPIEDSIPQLYLTRLSAWVPAVEAAWEQLNDEERYLATQATFSKLVPDPSGVTLIVGHGEIADWVGGLHFNSDLDDVSVYSSVIAVIETGFFGGHYYIQQQNTGQMAAETMRLIGTSITNYDFLFNMMDINAQNFQNW